MQQQQQQQGKQFVGGQGDYEKRMKRIERMAVIHGKMAMSILQTVKALQAMILINFQIPSEHAMADSIRAALAAHRERVFGVKGHVYGLADVWAGQAVTTTFPTRARRTR